MKAHLRSHGGPYCKSEQLAGLSRSILLDTRKGGCVSFYGL